MTEDPKKRIPREAQDEKGRFLPGNPGGLGRSVKRSPLHRAVPDEVAIELWEDRVTIAKGGPEVIVDEEGNERRSWARKDAAAEFILKHKTGSPPVAAPDIPAIAWPVVVTVEDLAAAVGAVLTAHSLGQIDGAGLKFLTGILVDLAKVFEVSDLAPKLRKLEEHIAAAGAIG